MKQWIIILLLFFTGVQYNVQASIGKNLNGKNLRDSNAVIFKIIYDQQDELNLYLDDQDFDFYDSLADINNYISLSIIEGRKILFNQNVEFSFLTFLLPNILDLPPPSDF
jgi:hypothetical protein